MTAFTDTFAGVNGTQLDSDGSSPAWAHDAGSSASATTVDGSNRVKGSVGTGGELAPSAGSADHYAQFTVANTSMASFICVRMTDSNNYIGFRITGGNYEIWQRLTGTFTSLKSVSFATAGVTPVAGTTLIKLGVSGSGPGAITVDINGSNISALNTTSTVNQTTQTPGIHNRGNELICGQTWTSDTLVAAPTITITETANKTGQTLPLDTGQTYKTVTFSGTYTGTAPSGVAVQLTNASGGAVVAAWATLSGATISGGSWSGTLQVSGLATYLLAQARETNDTSITSSLTTKSFNVGTVPLIIGQSLAARLWENSAQITDAATTNTSTTLTSVTVGANNNTNVLAGLSITGTNIPGGTTIVSNNGNNVVMSQAATGTGSSLTVNIGLTPPSATAGTSRYQGDACYPTTDLHHAAETDTLLIANCEGITTLANQLCSQLSAGAMILPYAVGSTRSKVWISPGGSGYTVVAGGTGVSGIGSDFDWCHYNNGQSDALAMTEAVTGSASGTGGVVRLTVADTSQWTTGASGTVTAVGGTTEANGTWTITVVDATHVELQGSVFANAWTSGGSVVSSSGTVTTTNLTNTEAWVQGYRAGAGFGITPVGSDTTGIDSSYNAVRQAQLTYIDTNASGKVFFGCLDLDFKRQDQFHLIPTERVRQAKRITQAYLRWRGLSASGYGPKIASVAWDGNVTVTVTVTHEAGTALRSKGLSSSGSSLTGFLVFGNGSAATISSTAFTQPNRIVLTLSSAPTGPVTLSYLAGANPTITNPVYDDQAPQSDSDGLPLQPSRGTSGLITAIRTGLPLDILSFGVAA
jgi:hypothetical protein